MERVEMSDKGHKMNDSEEMDNRCAPNALGERKGGKDESKAGEDAGRIQDQRSALMVEGRLTSELQKTTQYGWERVLSVKPLKVLLVENDDSTRLVVSALLQNCGYEVIPKPNGLQAWKTLEDLANHIDLVLTEVTLPGLSGIGLLSKIMSHKTRKSIPVIMMSSHDSMNIVFKCLSKGAVDYLVKPIRKNELRMLWQHVWRRCQSSSGSGSESSIRVHKPAKERSLQELAKNIGSEDEDESNGLNRDGSDNGSGTQSSWTKRAVSSSEQQAHQADGNGAQVNHSRPEMLGSNWTPLAPGGNEIKKHNNLQSNAAHLAKGSGNTTAKSSYLQGEDPTGKHEHYANRASGESCNKDDGKKEEKCLEASTERIHGGSLYSLPIITSATDPHKMGQPTSVPKDLPKISNMKNTAFSEAMNIPSATFTFNGHQDFKNTGTSSSDQQNFRHSDLSAFSKYNSGSTANERPTGNVGSCSPGDNSSDAAKTKPVENHQSVSNNTHTNQGSYGSSNNNDMGSTTNFTPKTPSVFNEKGKSTLKSSQPSSGVSLSVQRTANTVAPVERFHPQPPGIDLQNKELHRYHFYDPYGSVYSMPQVKQSANHDYASLQCGSSNVSGGVRVEGYPGNQSVNGSGSGSNHGSNGQIGCSIGLTPKGMRMESEDGIDERSRANFENSDGNGQRQHVISHREAALNKFRQKRKKRCFEKKVRYQGRKEIAKQRPRVHGQFVRKGDEENNKKDVRS